MERACIAIDLKSFYASVECVQRGLDPMRAFLVVADPSRTDKTICLAVSPALKAYGIPGRPRLFEVRQKLKEIHARTGEEIPLIIAPPQMAKYMQISADVYSVYLRFIAPEDIHVYSIDEVIMDVTAYLRTYGMTPHDLARRMIQEVLKETGITATAGIGTNLYLAKIAMDIMAKHVPADKDGVRIAELDEKSYRQRLWDYRPITAFWRIGRGTAAKLERNGMTTMGDVARRSLMDEESLYRLF
ncbi:MAG: DNA methylase, partial [Clostridia bacterium]|nr:DNA methylase [Clostridia bacterium]